jgi:putative redox protein
MPYLTVTHRGAHRFEVNVEGRRLLVDEGAAAGGRNSGPTPTELLAASLASCAAAHAESFLSAHGVPTAGLSTACHYRLSADRPARVADMDVTVTVAADLTADLRLALLKAVEECMVGNTLRMPPLIHIMVAAHETPIAG